MFDYTPHLIAAPRLVEFKSPQYFNIGQKFKLLCYLNEGDKADKSVFVWTKNDLPLFAGASSRYRVDTFQDESHFTVEHLLSEDSANFTCSVKTNQGFDKQTIILHVNG